MPGRRRVSVELDLQARGYLGTAKQVQVATRATERAIGELGDQADDTGRDLQQVAANADVAARRVDHLGDQARQSSVGLRWLEQTVAVALPLFPLAAQRADRLAASIDEVGDQALESAAAVGVLDRAVGRLGGFGGLQGEILRTRTSVARLRQEIGRTGDQALIPELNRQERALRRLLRLGDDLVPGNQAPGTGLFGIAARGRMGMWLNAARYAYTAIPVVLPILGMLASAVGGAVVGAVGAGGVVGGIALAADDPAVKQGFGRLGSRMMEGLRADAEVFTDPILGQMIPNLEASWDRMRPELRAFFRESAKLVDPLTEALGGFAEQLAPGLTSAARAAKPVMDMLTRELPELGRDITEFFESIERSAPQSAESLGNVLDIVGGLVRGIGSMIDMGGRFWENYRQDWWKMFMVGPAFDVAGQGMASQLWKAGRDALQVQATWVAPLNQVEFAFDRVSVAMARQRDELSRLNSAYHGFSGFAMDLDQAHQRVYEAMLRLREGIKHNGKDWRTTTEAGLANRSNLLNLVDAYENLRVKAIQQSDGTVEAQQRINAEYDRNIWALVALARRAGLTGAALQDLVGDYVMRILVQSTVDPATRLLFKLVTGTMGQFTFANLAGGSTTSTVTPPQRMAPQLGPYQGFAAGGQTPAYAPWRVHKDETVWDSYSTYVATAAQSRAMGAGSAPINLTVNLMDSPGHVTRSVLITDALSRGVPQPTVEVAYP